MSKCTKGMWINKNWGSVDTFTRDKYFNKQIYIYEHMHRQILSLHFGVERGYCLGKESIFESEDQCAHKTEMGTIIASNKVEPWNFGA